MCVVNGLRMDGLVRVVGTCAYVSFWYLCVCKFSLPGGGSILLLYILSSTLVAGFGIHREYEDSSSRDLLEISCKSSTLKIVT